jgi:hypothetical protein
MLQVYSAAYHAGSELLVVGFSNGTFGVYTMPDCTCMHTLSISQHRVHSAAINPSGEWLAFASQSLGQLLVWEWQSETCTCAGDLSCTHPPNTHHVARCMLSEHVLALECHAPHAV